LSWTNRPVVIASRRSSEGDNSEDIYRSPLTEVGVNASVGDYVLAIDGEELKATDDPYRLLRNKADNPVQLTINKTPSMQGARTVSYRPITDEQNLIYLDWVDHNREKVSKATTAALVICTFPTWARTEFASSSSGTTRNSRRKR
jgi:C-terminal processing protease CtpA/Prc